MPPNPLSPYALQKFAGERYATMFYQLYGFETVVLRYFNIYGPRQNPESQYAAVIPRFIRALKRGEAPTIFGDGSASRDFTYVDDAVEANLLATTVPAAAGEVFNCAGGRQITVSELVQTLQEILGTKIAPSYQPPRPGDILHSYADLEKARRILGYKPKVSFEDGLKLTAASIF